MSRKRIMGKRPPAITGAKRANDCDPGMVGFSAMRLILLLAYVDPGSAGFIITTVLGVLAAGGYIVRSYLYRFKQWLFRRHNVTELGEVANSPDDQAHDG